MNVAFFAGSFDPITLGHLDLIERATKLFEQVIVGVGVNPNKRYRFSTERRAQLIEACVPEQVQVVSFEGLTAPFAKSLGATVLLRGVRSADDVGLEMRNGHGNREIFNIETLVMFTEPRFGHVSSSLVREIASHGGDVSRYVPAAVSVAFAE